MCSGSQLTANWHSIKPPDGTGGAVPPCLWAHASHDLSGHCVVLLIIFDSVCVQASAFGAAPVVWEITATANPSPLAAHIPAGLAPIRRPRSDPLSAFTRAKAEPAAAARGLAAATGMVKSRVVDDGATLCSDDALRQCCKAAVSIPLHSHSAAFTPGLKQGRATADRQGG
jgi:hypothetical protein